VYAEEKRSDEKAVSASKWRLKNVVGRTWGKTHDRTYGASGVLLVTMIGCLRAVSRRYSHTTGIAHISVEIPKVLLAGNLCANPGLSYGFMQ
jgi:hypothetical protein